MPAWEKNSDTPSGGTSPGFRASRIFFGLLFSCVFLSTLVAVKAATLTAGDLAPRGSPDGQLNAADLLILQQLVLGTNTPIGDDALVADVAPLGAPDGELNAGDVVVLMRAIQGDITLPPVVTGTEAPALDTVVSPTSNNPQSITGSAPPNIEVRLYVNGLQQDTGLSDAGGQFSFTAVLRDGMNSIYATTWDGSVESEISNMLSVEYENTISRNQGGTITQATVWTPGVPNEPYVINSSLVIASGANLILAPGTVVQFPADYTLRIEGDLVVQGTAAEPVVLTSSRATPAANNWQGVLVTSSATRVVIEYAEIRYADRGIEFAVNALSDTGACDTFCVRNSLIENSLYGLFLSGAAPWIEGNVIQGMLEDGIYMTNASSPQVRGNTIQNNGNSTSYDAGIEIRDGSNPVITAGNVITGNSNGIRSLRTSTSTSYINPLPVITGNSIHSNTSWQLFTDTYADAGTVTLDATGNWWGTTDAGAIGVGIRGNGDATDAPVVDYRDYLDGPGGTPVAQTLLGSLAADTTLVAGTVYEVLGTLRVPAGVTLTIPAGVTLRFDGGTNTWLVVDGALVVQGTVAEPVVITSGQAVPAANDWQGIYVASTATRVVIEHAQIRYAQWGVVFNPSTLTDTGVCDTFCVRNSVIANNLYGLHITGASPWIEGNLIEGNTNDGIRVINGSPDIRGNTIQNGNYGLYLEGSSPWIEGNVIQGMLEDGIYMTNASSPQVRGNTIQNNGNSTSYDAGIEIRDGSNPVITAGNVITGNSNGIRSLRTSTSTSYINPLPVITGNNIHSNTSWQLFTDTYADAGTVTLDATGNWWGTTDAGAIGVGIRGNGDATDAPVVDYRDYLDGPGGTPVAQTLLGSLAADTTLVAGTVYEVLGTLRVPAGVTLTIPAGVTLRFDGGTNTWLVVDGALVVQGTVAEPVVITSGQAVPAANDWQGIYVASTATRVVIEHAQIRYAQWGVVFNPSTLTDTGVCDTFCVRNSVIANNLYGLHITGASPWIEGNLIEGNTNDGIRVINGSPDIRGNTIQNGNYGLYLEGSSPWIEGNVIQGMLEDGIYMTNASSPQVRGNTIQNNGNSTSVDAGIEIRDGSNPVITAGNVITGNSNGIRSLRTSTSTSYINPLPVITGNSIHSNTSWQLFTDTYADAGTVTLDATGNWWGTTYRAAIEAGIRSNLDATDAPVVDYQGYLDGPGGDPVPVVFLQGDLSSDTTLVAGTVYEVIGTVRVLSGVTLTVTQGALLRFDGAANTLIVEGALVVQGTEAAPVVFTSGQQTPTTADWGGIVIASSATAVVIDYAEISYANRAIQFNPSGLIDTGICGTMCVRNSRFENNNTALYVDGAAPWVERNVMQFQLDDGIFINSASPNVRGNTIQWNGNNGTDDAGIDIRGNSSPVITDGNQINNNSRYGLYIYGSQTSGLDPTPVITGNGLYRNTIYDFYASNFFDAANITLDVTANWWETTIPEIVAARVYDNSDNPSLAPIADTSNFATDPAALGLVIMSVITQNQKTIRPLANETLEIDLNLSVQATVTFTVYDEKTRLPAYESIQLLDAGLNTLVWNGRDSADVYVPDEAYVYEIRAANPAHVALSSPSGGGTTGSGSGAIDTTYNAYTNDFWEIDYNLAGDGRILMRVTPAGGTAFYPIENVPYEAGIHHLLWNGRDPDGTIVSGNAAVYFAAPTTLPSNLVIVRSNPVVSGTGTAPDIEVKSNPYRIMHTYQQFSQIGYRIDQDALVTVKLLPPGITDLSSAQAVTLVDNVLTAANDGGGQPLDHVVEWRGYDAADTNNILVSEEGAFTFTIQATSVATGISTTYRGALQIYR